MEAYIVVEGSRFDRAKAEEVNNKKKSKHYNHLILLAKNKQGYDNLSRLSTLGHTEGFYYKPRIDLEILKQYREGLICTTACAGGVVSTHLVNGNYEKAREVAKKFKDIFEDDFYLEIQDHGMDVDKPILEGMPKLSKELGIKLVATNDCHYIEHEHAIAHNILLLLSDKNGADYTQLRYGTDQVYFKSSDEMTKIFKKYKGAIEHTLEIEEKVDLKLDIEGYHFPNFPIPKESKAKNLDEYMELLARQGLEKKISDLNRGVDKSQQDVNILIPMKLAPDLANKYLKIYQELKIQYSILEFVTPLYEQAKIEEVRNTPTVLVLDNAVPADHKAKPKAMIYAAVSFTASIIFGFIIIFLIELMKKMKLVEPTKYQYITQQLMKDLSKVGIKRKSS